MFILIGLMFVAGFSFAQDITPPESIPEVFTGLSVYLGSLAGVAALSVFVTALITTSFTIVKWLKRVISWLVPIIIVVGAGYLFHFGFLAEAPFLTVLLYGLGAGLVSNGLFDIELVQAVLVALKLKDKKDEV